MPITGTNLKWYLSGGAGNTDPAASLGGARSTTVVGSGLNNLFDDVGGDEAAAGDVEYRCLYFRNEDADADGLMAPAKLWIDGLTSAAGDEIDIGLDPAGKNAAATTIANESAAPAGVTFTRPTSKGAGLDLPSLPFVQNDFVGIWIRRTVSAGAGADSNDVASIRVEGDTV
jgi:hypothetical protein